MPIKIEVVDLRVKKTDRKGFDPKLLEKVMEDFLVSLIAPYQTLETLKDQKDFCSSLILSITTTLLRHQFTEEFLIVELDNIYVNAKAQLIRLGAR